MTRPDPKLAAIEFDKWAKSGRSDTMAAGHGSAMRQATAAWRLDAASVLVDVGCGNGWTLHQLLNGGRGYGYDISPEMIAQGLERCDDRMTLAVASADALPLEDDVATHILSVESLYYYASPAAALVEWARVARPGCELSIVIDLYVENPGSHPWIDALEVDVHLLSTADCVGLLQEAGWREVVTRQVRSERPPKPREAFEPSPYFPSYEQYLSTIETGSLVIEAKR